MALPSGQITVSRTVPTPIAAVVPDEAASTFGSTQSIWSPQSSHTTASIPSPSTRRIQYIHDDAPHGIGSFDGGSLIHLPDHHSSDLGPAAENSHIVSIESLLQAAETAGNLLPYGRQEVGLRSTGYADSPATGHKSPLDIRHESFPSDDFPLGNAIRHISSPISVHDIGVQEACLMRYFVDNLACWVSEKRLLPLT